VAAPIDGTAPERRHQRAGFINADGWHGGDSQNGIERCATERLREGIAVAHPRYGEGPEHTQLLQPALQSDGLNGFAVVRNQYQKI